MKTAADKFRLAQKFLTDALLSLRHAQIQAHEAAKEVGTEKSKRIEKQITPLLDNMDEMKFGELDDIISCLISLAHWDAEHLENPRTPEEREKAYQEALNISPDYNQKVEKQVAKNAMKNAIEQH